MSRSWFLVQTKAGHELLAEAHLRRQNYETFLPRSCRTIRHARRVQVVTQAHFPGYIFVGFDMARDRWRNINHTRGVIRLVTGNDRPLRVPCGVVEMLQARCDAKGLIDLMDGLKVGDEVRVIRGPLADRMGLIDRLIGEDRVRVLISMLSAEAAVEVDRTACEAA